QQDGVDAGARGTRCTGEPSGGKPALCDGCSVAPGEPQRHGRTAGALADRGTGRAAVLPRRMVRPQSRPRKFQLTSKPVANSPCQEDSWTDRGGAPAASQLSSITQMCECFSENDFVRVSRTQQ